MIMAISKIAAFGDSLTAGVALKEGEKNWTDMISEALGVEVKNCGVGGNTTAAGLLRMDADVIACKPDVVLICFGMNDHVIKDSLGQTKTSEHQFMLNLREMVGRVTKIGARAVLITPNAVIEDYYFGRHPREWYGGVGGANAQLERFCDIIRRLAREDGIPLVDVFELSKGRDLSTLLRTPEHGGLADGVHPYGEGIKLYAEAITAVLQKII
jgi:lysophospholipase L1-like esterase